MSEQDRYVLEQIIEQEHKKNVPTLTKDKYFEIFSAEQVLKERAFDLDPDQIQSGIIGGGGDGGVDSFYVFVNRMLVREDTDLTLFKDQQLAIELIIIQSRNKGGFQEAVIKNLLDFTENCLRLNADLKSPPATELFNSSILECVARFHSVYRPALSLHPTLTIRFCYASLGEQVDKKVDLRAQMLKDKCKEYYSTATCTFDFIGSKRLLELQSRAPVQTFDLDTIKNLSWSLYQKKAYVCLAQLPKFYEFIAPNDVLREHIFEANVRDYQGEVAINKEIRASLATAGGEDFWWLNNGITIVTSKAVISGDTVTMTDPLIVNGLQTSYEIFSHFKQPSVEKSSDRRCVVIRIVESSDAQGIDRIIKATNSQTKIPPMWLHATEPIHRKIEASLKSADLYYDRRKNHHRNKGVPIAKIVTITYLAQAIAAIALQRPDDARARPSTVASRHYKQMFSDDMPMELYTKCAQILKRSDAFLNEQDIEPRHKLNIIFYLAMYATCTALGSSAPKRQRIAGINVGLVADKMESSYQKIKVKYEQAGGDDRAAKGTELLESLNHDLKKLYKRSEVKARRGPK